MSAIFGELVVLSGPFKGRRVPLAKPRVLLGRDKNCDVSLDDEAVSRAHSEIQCSEAQIRICDKESTNGTFVNDARIVEPMVLKNGDRLGIGDTVFLVELSRSGGGSSPNLVFLDDRKAITTHLTLSLDDTRFLQLKEGISIPDAQRQFTLLYDFMVEISGVLHRQALMERVVDYLLKTFRADRGVILLITEEGEPGQRIIRVREGSDSSAHIAISRTMAQQLLEKKESFLSVDAESDERLAHSQSIHEMRVRSIMGVPLKLKDRVLGMVYLDKLVAGHAFSEMDLKLCTAMALQAAVCIENATLYAELLDSAEFNTSVLSSLASGLMVIDLNDQILRVNRAAARILRKEEGALVGKRLAGFADLQELSRVVLATFRTGLSEDRYEIRVVVDGQQVPLGLTTSLLADHDGQPIGVVANFRDLTHIRRLEEQLRRSQHLAALGQMAAGVAHEIRNPLNSIRGFTQLIQEEAGRAKLDNPKFQEYPKIVLEEVDRMNLIVQDLLDYSRQRELTLTPVQLPALVSELAVEMGPDFKSAGVKLELLSPEEPLPGVLGSEDKLRQVFRNIILNAIQASRPGQVVRVSIEKGQASFLKKNEEGLTIEVERQELGLVIQDEGTGIAPEDLPRIFDPFFTQKEVGTGLGLSISQKIVDQHGGRIEVRSTLGQGTLFKVLLPVP